MPDEPPTEPSDADTPEPEQDPSLEAPAPVNQSGHMCPDCEKLFDNVGSLNLHMHSAHSRAKQNKDKYCPQCNAGPYYDSDLKSHISKKHRGDDLPKPPEVPPIPSAATEEPDEAPVEYPDDDEPVFKGPRNDASKRRRRLEQALAIFDLKPKARQTILNVWDNYQDVRSDEREFHTFLLDIDGIEPSQARRIVDMVFEMPAQAAPDPYYGRRAPAQYQPQYPPPSGYRGEPNQQGYYQQPPPYGQYSPYGVPQSPYPPMEPQKPKGFMTEEEFDRKWREREMAEESAKKDQLIKDMENRLQRMEQGPPQDQNRGPDPRDKRLEELEKEIDRVKQEKQLEAYKSRFESRMGLLERELEHAKSSPKDMVDQLERAGALGQKPGLGDQAQVAITELNKKADTLTHTMDNFTDVVKTWITMQAPMSRRPGSAMSQDELDAARRELGG